MTFLLDTDTCIYAMKRERGVLEKLLAHSRSEVCVSVVTMGELLTGAAKSREPTKTERRVRSFLAPIDVLGVDSDDASAYAKLRARLEKSGKSIGPLDTWIAAQAFARRLTLVTNNQREFRRVTGLSLDNWAR